MADERDPEELREYHGARIVVEWRPGLCQHSGVCARGLPDVFNPRRRPWIDILATDESAIERQVSLCPSGALRSRRKD